MKANHPFRDKSGELYKFPDRSCSKCEKLQICLDKGTYIIGKSCDRAKYGCRKYIEKK